MATINIQSYGIPAELAAILGKFLELAKYYIKTGTGVSARLYCHTKERGAFGSGQGSAVSMYIWSLIVSKIMDIFEKFRHGSSYTPPSANGEGILRKIIIAILSFVDDCNISNTGEKYETIKDILQRTQSDAQLWNDLIRSTGGALELKKCFMQVIAINGGPVVGPARHDLHVELMDRVERQVTILPISSYSTVVSAQFKE